MTPSSRPAKRRKIADASSNKAEEGKQVKAEEITKHRLPLADGDVCYVEDFLDKSKAAEWYEELLKLDTWYSPTLKMYGREFQQSRQIAAYAHMPFDLQYSGTTVKMETEYPPILREIECIVAEKTGVTFNHCMLNRYDDGSVYIGKHRDNLENKVIASVSLGAERDFIMTHDKFDKSNEVDLSNLMQKRWKLKNGSLLIMQGETQRFWKHEIVRFPKENTKLRYQPKQLRIKSGRISLTFRQMQFT